ncbi:MAG: lysine--tRNA ligase [Spirochaetia bacterium]|nr:lysine--tRNA ligase [Spirochaetia bacterium]
MSEENPSEIYKQRLQKLNKIKELGKNPYPNNYQKEYSTKEIKEKYFSTDEIEQSVLVKTAGRIFAKRPMGKAGFVHIQDEEGIIQVYANDKTLSSDEHEIFLNLDIGDIIGVEGEPFRTKTGEASLRAKVIDMLSKNISPIPVVKEKDGKIYDAFSDVETRYRQRYLDLIVNSSVRKNFILRSKIITEIRNFMNERKFLEVETPMMQSIASGAAAQPFKTHHNALNIPLYLRIAPELFLKRLLVGGVEKVYELNRNFRNEGISTKHNPEFTMMEVYQAYADYKDMMALVEDLFSYLAQKITGKDEVVYGEHTISLKKPWQQKTYLGIIKEKTGIDFNSYLADENPSVEEAKSKAKEIGVDVSKLNTFWEVVDEIFSEKVEPYLIQPVFITHYPKAVSPLAKNIPDNKHIVERFEPYIVGREMGNAFSELNDPFEQEKRFLEQVKMKEAGAHEIIEMDEDYIEALKVGMPPAGGLGIGIDRLVMLFTNASSIKDVILFPLLRPKLEK